MKMKPHAPSVLAKSVSKASLTSLSAASLILGAVASPTALAQEQEQEQERSRLVLEEVIVTARKREESIQDVPISVTSIAQELQEASLRRLDDIQAFTPNVYIRNTAGTPGGAALSIRGVSYQEIDKSFDPAIGVILDGMYLGTSSGALLNSLLLAALSVFLIWRTGTLWAHVEWLLFGLAVLESARVVAKPLSRSTFQGFHALLAVTLASAGVVAAFDGVTESAVMAGLAGRARRCAVLTQRRRKLRA